MRVVNNTLPDPLVPTECDVRSMPYMKLHVDRLLNSDLIAMSTGDEFKAWMILACRAWHQIPAGSLPADDRALAFLSGSGAAWSTVKAMALHGWGKCNDGRLYHPVLAEQVLDAWEQRLNFRSRTEAARKSRAEKRRLDKDLREQNGKTPSVTDSVTEVVTSSVAGSRGERREERVEREEEDTSLRSVSRATAQAPSQARAARKKSAREEYSDAFLLFWLSYPRKQDQPAAWRAWKARRCDTLPHGTILEALTAYCAEVDGKDRQFIKLPATWLNNTPWREVSIFDTSAPLLNGEAPHA